MTIVCGACVVAGVINSLLVVPAKIFDVGNCFAWKARSSCRGAMDGAEVASGVAKGAFLVAGGVVVVVVVVVLLVSVSRQRTRVVVEEG